MVVQLAYGNVYIWENNVSPSRINDRKSNGVLIYFMASGWRNVLFSIAILMMNWSIWLFCYRSCSNHIFWEFFSKNSLLRMTFNNWEFLLHCQVFSTLLYTNLMLFIAFILSDENERLLIFFKSCIRIGNVFCTLIYFDSFITIFLASSELVQSFFYSITAIWEIRDYYHTIR